MKFMAMIFLLNLLCKFEISEGGGPSRSVHVYRYVLEQYTVYDFMQFISSAYLLQYKHSGSDISSTFLGTTNNKYSTSLRTGHKCSGNPLF